MTDVLTPAMRDYIASLSEVEAGRVMTTTMEPVGAIARVPLHMTIPAKCGCLMMTAQAVKNWSSVRNRHGSAAGLDYEYQCRDHGVEAVNTAIRDYICELRTTRELAPVRELVG